MVSTSFFVNPAVGSLCVMYMLMSSVVAVTIYDDGLSQFSRSLMKGEDSTKITSVLYTIHSLLFSVQVLGHQA